MKTRSFNVTYGAFELRELYKKYITESLVIAGIFHFALVGGYHLYSQWNKEEVSFPTDFWKKRVTIYTPPSIHNTLVVPNISVASGTVQPSIGLPIPIPDNEIDPNATIVENKDLTPTVGSDIGEPNGNTTVITDGVNLNDNDMPPDFRAVEKPPIAIKQIYPPYPEIPRRAGVEGTVHIKMWVTKEGKVKRAEVFKSSSELFDQVALDAAMQWTFTPAIMNNGPVDVWVTVPFEFRLNQ